MKLTQRQVDAWLSRWQKLLRLLDWTIKAKLKRGHEMDEAEGSCSITLSRRLASIEIEDPNDSAGPPPWEPDPETVLVHELIHCHFDPIFPKNKDSQEYVAAEQAIEALAIAFTTLDRSKRSK